MQASTAANSPACFTVHEVAERLRCQSHIVRKDIREGRLTAFKVGRSYRIELADIERYITPERAERLFGSV